MRNGSARPSAVLLTMGCSLDQDGPAVLLSLPTTTCQLAKILKRARMLPDVGFIEQFGIRPIVAVGGTHHPPLTRVPYSAPRSTSETFEASQIGRAEV